MSDEEDLVPVFIPSLSAILVNAEDNKGSPLTKEEALEIRDKASVVMLSKQAAEQMNEKRGYSDIDPENCWYDWQMLRRETERKPDLDPGIRFSHLSSSDEEINSTVLEARETFGNFQALIDELVKGDVFPLVKTLIEEGGYKAHLWLYLVQIEGTKIIGELFEVPEELSSYKVGGRIEMNIGSLEDWMINDNGVLYGGYSLRYARSKMTQSEQERFDDHVGVEKYA